MGQLLQCTYNQYKWETMNWFLYSFQHWLIFLILIVFWDWFTYTPHGLNDRNGYKSTIRNNIVKIPHGLNLTGLYKANIVNIGCKSIARILHNKKFILD